MSGEVNHKWKEQLKGETLCARCGLRRRRMAKTTFEFFVEGKWGALRVIPDCDPRPRSERNLPR